MTAMEAALELVRAGVIAVRDDGTVWKLSNLNAMKIAGPRRLETRTKNGYLAVRVNLSGKAFMLSAHRLVWTVLRGPIPPGLEINHRDGCPTNNHPTNLELATGSENLTHSYRMLGRKPPRTVPKPILADVAPAALALREKGMSFAEIAKDLGVSQTTAFRAVTFARSARS